MNNAYIQGLKDGASGIIGEYSGDWQAIYASAWFQGWFETTGRRLDK